MDADAAWAQACRDARAHPDSLARLERAAAAARAITRLTVVDKRLAAPGADPHDYVSQAPYWWPDPSRPGGLPYVRRDGETNPESLAGDRTTLEALHRAVVTLALHAGAAGCAESARHAARLLRQWFLDPATRMNPHLRYAQRIPGVCEGRGIGIIDTATIGFLLDAAARLTPGEAWTAGDRQGLREWVSSYLDWLLQSDPGRRECGEHNNHGTWFDAQVVACAVFCGRHDVAARQVERHTLARLDTHLAADGSQPHELARTRALSYSTFNLLGFACLAQAGPALGFDLWGRRGLAGAGLPQAVRWLLPFYLGERAWAWPQIVPFRPAPAVLLLGLAARGTGAPDFAEACARLARDPWERVCLAELT